MMVYSLSWLCHSLTEYVSVKLIKFYTITCAVYCTLMISQHIIKKKNISLKALQNKTIIVSPLPSAESAASENLVFEVS